MGYQSDKEVLETFKERLNWAIQNKYATDKYKKISLEQVGKDCGNIAKSTIYNYYTGNRLPDGLILRKLAIGLNVTADFLLGLESEPGKEERLEELERITGLSKKVIKALKSLHNDSEEVIGLSDISPAFCVNFLLEDRELRQSLRGLMERAYACESSKRKRVIAEKYADKLTQKYREKVEYSLLKEHIEKINDREHLNFATIQREAVEYDLTKHVMKTVAEMYNRYLELIEGKINEAVEEYELAAYKDYNYACYLVEEEIRKRGLDQRSGGQPLNEDI